MTRFNLSPQTEIVETIIRWDAAWDIPLINLNVTAPIS